MKNQPDDQPDESTEVRDDSMRDVDDTANDDDGSELVDDDDDDEADDEEEDKGPIV